MSDLQPLDGPLYRTLAPLPLAHARRVLVLAPHPDDECIGCGGLIVALRRRGVPVKVVLVSDGGGAGGLPPEAAAIRQREFDAALRRLGVEEQAKLGFVDGDLHASAGLPDAIRDAVRAWSPNWLLAPTSADAHRDHRAVARAARTAALSSATVEQLLEYEISTPLPASHVLDIGDVLAVKLAALAEHATALAHGRYVEATEGLARYRGLQLGTRQPDTAAEAYLLLDRRGGYAWPAGTGTPDP